MSELPGAPPKEAPIPDHLEEISTLERIELVKNDNIRRWGQIIISFFMIAFTVGFIIWYAIFKADDVFLQYLALGMVGMVFGGIGAAFAIMGLGRTVGRK